MKLKGRAQNSDGEDDKGHQRRTSKSPSKRVRIEEVPDIGPSESCTEASDLEEATDEQTEEEAENEEDSNTGKKKEHNRIPWWQLRKERRAQAAAKEDDARKVINEGAGNKSWGKGKGGGHRENGATRSPPTRQGAAEGQD